MPMQGLDFEKKSKTNKGSWLESPVRFELILPSTVGINPRVSDLKGSETSNLDWRYLYHNKIDRNELQIRTNSQKGTGTKMAEKLNNLEKIGRRKVKFQPCS